MNCNRCPICAAARISGSPAYPKLHGTVQFKQLHSGVLVTARICNLPCDCPPGKGIFAFHIHEGTSCCKNGEAPFPAAGSHYNPGNCPHPFHAGDLPPLFGNNGYAFMSVFTNRFTVNEIVGHVVIIHGGPDDFTSQPSGNAGDKIACGKICLD